MRVNERLYVSQHIMAATVSYRYSALYWYIIPGLHIWRLGPATGSRIIRRW